MENNLLLRIISKLLIPFIALFAFYVQFHGDFGPGGGFQAGVILAAAIILYSLIFGIKKSQTLITIQFLKLSMCFGLIIYCITGFFGIFSGSNFLDYNTLNSNNIFAQELGIFIVELGVGICVFSVMLLIFYLFISREKK